MTCRLVLAVALLPFAGCDETSATRQSTSAPIEVRSVDLHVVATPESVAVVEDLAVLPDGSVWVENSTEPFFVGLAPRGDIVAAHGHAGGGPEEFRAPWGLVVGGRDGEAWVFDRGRHSFIRISNPEAAHEEIPLPRNAIPPGSVMGGSLIGTTIRTARMGDELLLPRRTGTGEILLTLFWTTIWNADLVAFHPETGSVRTVLSLREVMGDLAAHFDTLNGGGFPPFPLWHRLWAVCSDDEIRLYDFVRNELRGFTAEGMELDPVPVPPPFIEVTPRQFARAAFDLAAAEQAGAVTAGVGEMSTADSARILEGLVERLDASPSQLAGLLPEYVDFRCADDGTMWLRPLDLVRGGMDGGPTWLRITPDGEMREVRFPERFDPYRFTSGRIWGVQRNEVDVASVAWVEIGGSDGG